VEPALHSNKLARPAPWEEPATTGASRAAGPRWRIDGRHRLAILVGLRNPLRRTGRRVRLAAAKRLAAALRRP
jgi:hypothetical protein